jgi:DNA-binding LacI/PurR family transcriptional regulator
MNRVTIRDIANASGYSKTTVSFAFNDPDRIGKETREKILRIADELGYVPDPVARNLSLRRQGTIGLLLPDPIARAFFNPYLAQIVQGIGAICERECHSLTLIPPVRESLLEGIRGAAVDGLITLGLEPGTDTVDFIKRRHLPFVTIDGRVGGDFPVVGIDDRGAAATAMQYVLDLGHREIAIVSFAPDPEGRSGTHVETQRIAGYREAVDRSRVQGADISTRIYYAESSIAGGTEAAERMLDEGLPTAVVTMSDILGVGVIDRFTRAGVTVPDEVTIVGFDDIPEARLVRPELSTIAQPGYEKGHHAAESLLRLIAHKEAPRHTVLDASLVVRGSSAPPPLDAVR